MVFKLGSRSAFGFKVNRNSAASGKSGFQIARAGFTTAPGVSYPVPEPRIRSSRNSARAIDPRHSAGIFRIRSTFICFLFGFSKIRFTFAVNPGD
ncbi:hypothetical protein [uncultured Alistipes sp.]|uniref:hypothetical protein n=1 Tax=uncultured Alistipes sp. TaxID=538949 RepID=UPI0026318DF4|nr:hypothetical protein [uncultured Alistipes sp.]